MTRPDAQLGVEWEILELLCHPASDSRRDRVAALVEHPALDWGDLLNQAIRHQLLTLLADAVGGCLPSSRVPHPIATHLRHNLRMNLHRTQTYRRQAKHVTAELAAAGVTHVVIGGAAVESTLYGGTGARPINDLDVLVHPDDLSAAHATVAQLTSAGLPSLHVTTGDPITPAVHVDIQTDLPLPGPPSDGPVPIRAILDHAVAQPVPGENVLLPVPCPGDLAGITALRLFRKAWTAPARGRDVTLLPFADLLRLHASGRRAEPDCTRWRPALRHLAWVTNHLQRVFHPDAPPNDADEAWLAGIIDRQHQPRQWTGSMRSRLHATGLPVLDSTAAA